METLVVGFPYVRENFFAVFRQWPDPGKIQFLLPKRWPIKGGAVVYAPPSDPRIETATTWFADYRSRYPIIGGLLKGVMPAFPLFLWRNRHCRVVYACSEPILLTTLYYALWTRLFGKKLVLFSWENIDYKEKFKGLSFAVHRGLIALNLRLAHGLLCGNTEAQAIHGRLRPGLKTAVVPMSGVDETVFTRHPTQGHPNPLTGKVVYAFVGALGKRKGVHLILAAMREVLERVPNAHLVIAGSGEYEVELKRLTDEPFLAQKVTRFPWISHHEMVRLLSSADVFVYPSVPMGGWAEQFGYSMAEASLMELPVISTRSGSIPDVVRDGQTGILVPPGDVPALTEAMVRLGTNEDLRQRMGAAGRAYIISKYSNAAVAKTMYDFFRTL